MSKQDLYLSGRNHADENWSRGAIDELALHGSDSFCRGYQDRYRELRAQFREQLAEERRESEERV